MSLKMSTLFDKGYDNHQLNIVEKQCAVLAHLVRPADVFSSRFNNEAVKELRQNIKDSEAKSVVIQGLFSLVKANKQIGIFPFYSFVVSIAKVEDKNIVVATLLQFNTLVAAYELSKLEGYEDYIVRAFDAVRILFTTPKYAPILDLLEVRRSYTGKYFRLLKLKSKEGTYLLTSLASFFDKHSAGLPRITKRIQKATSTIEKQQTQRNFSIAESSISFESGETTYSELLSSNTNIDPSMGSFLEINADEKTATRHLEFDIIAPEEVQKSVRSQAQIANAVAANIERREKALSTDSRYLTQHELSVLIDECMQNIQEIDYGLLFLSLATGRTVVELLINKKKLVLSNKPPFKGYVVIHHKLSLPSYQIDKRIKKLISTSNGDVVLVLPRVLTDVVRKIVVSDLRPDEALVTVSECLTKLNRVNNTRLSLAKINNVLSFYLSNIGADTAEIAFMRNKGITQQAGCYYYQVPVQKLIDHHQCFLSSLDEDEKYNLNDFAEDTKLKVGSSLQVQRSCVISLFSLLHQSMTNFKQQGWPRIEDLHNYLTMYTLFLLNLSTGHRPVINPYHTLSSFDLIARTVFISDKEARGSQSARVLKIPAIALEQLNNYISHLTSIQRYFSQLSVKNGEFLKGVIKGENPLFHMIENGKFLAVTPRILDRFCLDILPLPQNWHRHFIRTWLRNNGAKPYSVDAWMGHIGADGDPFSRYSGASMKDLESISTLLNKLLTQDLNIKPFKSM